MTQLDIGKKYTASANLRHGDRSYSTGVHTVTALNATHVQTSYHDNLYRPHPVILIISEHNFSPAEDFAAPTGHFDPPGTDPLAELLSDALN